MLSYLWGSHPWKTKLGMIPQKTVNSSLLHIKRPTPRKGSWPTQGHPHQCRGELAPGSVGLYPVHAPFPPPPPCTPSTPLDFIFKLLEVSQLESFQMRPKWLGLGALVFLMKVQVFLPQSWISSDRFVAVHFPGSKPSRTCTCPLPLRKKAAWADQESPLPVCR